MNKNHLHYKAVDLQYQFYIKLLDIYYNKIKNNYILLQISNFLIIHCHRS